MIKRRAFLKDVVLASATASILPSLYAATPKLNNVNRTKILNAYYLRAHMYTLVPKHVKEDLKWMPTGARM